MKRILITIAVLLCIISFSYVYTNNSIYNFIYKHDYEFINNELFYKKENTKENYSNYIKYLNTDDINNTNELYSMFYTILNNGYDIYTFNCKYNCYNDIEKIDSLKLSLINQLVDPKNSYKEINTTYYNDKKVTLKINKKYTKEELNKIDKELDRLIKELKINNYESITDKIVIFHDYIANNSSYDTNMANNGTSNYHSNTAIGPLFEGKAICDGYSDALAFYLNKLNIENIKITNDKHVWNAVKINGIWYHIDLTWDDPIYTNGSNLVIHDYFMITTKELKSKNNEEHSFDELIYDFIK